MQDGHVQQKALVIFLVGLVFLIFKKYPSVVKCEVVFKGCFLPPVEPIET